MGTLTLADLQNMSPDDLDKMTKSDLIASITGDQTTTVCVNSVDLPEGQALRVFVTKDLDGTVLKTEQWTWTYNEAGEVAEITGVVLDGNDRPLSAGKILQTDNQVEYVVLDLKEAPAILEQAKGIDSIPIRKTL